MSDDTFKNDDSNTFFDKGQKIKLPLWYGNIKKDIFKPEHWIASVQRAKTIYKWNNDTFIHYVQTAFRDEALIWFNMLEGIDKKNWDRVKEEFLRVYGSLHPKMGEKLGKGHYLLIKTS